MTTSAIPTAEAMPKPPAQSRGAVPKASEKRKAQNRAAQKTYREKRKKRLQELEQLAAEAGLTGEKQAPGAGAGASVSVSVGADIGDTSESATPESVEPESGTASDSSQSASQSVEQPFSNFFTSGAELGYSSQTSDPTRLNSSLEPRILELDELFDDQSWLNADVSSDGSNSLTTLSPSLWPSTTLQTSYKSSSSSLSDTSLDDLTRTPPNIQLYLADPVANQLAFRAFATFSALFEIVTHLGMPLTDPCTSDGPSMFYRPDISRSANAPLLVAAVQNTFTTIKPDLRPTSRQITRQHPAYIDVLPFRDMRDRLIDLLVASTASASADLPPLFDEDEFWRDMDSGGLVCWGSTAPAKGVSNAGCGAPWDARSWEAKTWFLAKWNWVVGGDDSELARSSEWWRTMRGEGQGFSF